MPHPPVATVRTPAAATTLLATLAVAGMPPAAATSSDCDAIVAVWTGESSASVHDPDNWSTGTVPGPDTTIVFEDPGFVAISLDGVDLAVGRMIIRGGAVGLFPDGGVLSVSTADGDAPVECPTVLIGGPTPAVLDLDINVPEPLSFAAESVVLGTSDGAGWLSASVPLFTEAAIEQRMVVGGEDVGRLERLARVTAGSLVVGRGAEGRVDIVQALEVAGTAVVGDAAVGEIARTELHLGELIVGAQRSGSGHVIVQQGGEPDVVLGDVELGSRGFGLLEVRRPLTVGGNVRLGIHAEGMSPGWLDRGDGFLVVDSSLEIGGELLLGLLGHARMDLGPGSHVTVGGDVGFTVLDGGVEPDRLVRIALGTPSDGDPPFIAASIG